MLTYARESGDDVIYEIKSLLARHWTEHVAFLGVCNPAWDAYVKAESLKFLQIYTCRDDGKLVGYAIFWVRPSLHQLHVCCAVSDVIWIDPAYRGRRHLAGHHLLGFAMKGLTESGANRIYIEGTDTASSLLNWLLRRGFKRFAWFAFKDVGG